MAIGDPDAPSNREAGKMGSRDTSNRSGPEKKKKNNSGIEGPDPYSVLGDDTKDSNKGTEITFAGETEAEAAARRAAGGQGQRPENFTPGSGSPQNAATSAVSAQSGGFSRQVNVGGVAIPRTNRIGKRNTQSGLSIPGF